MAKSEPTTLAVVAGACVVCCLPLIVAAGPGVAVGGAVVAGTGAVAAVVRRARHKREAEASRTP